MDCIDISNDAFEAISSELVKAERQCGAIETVCGIHEDLGLTVLLRDASRCMALVDDRSVLDQIDAGVLSLAAEETAHHDIFSAPDRGGLPSRACRA